MNKIIYKKLAPYIIFLIFLLSTFNFISFKVAALGEQNDYMEDFEDDTATYQSEDFIGASRWINSSVPTGTAYVETVVSNPPYGDNVYRVQSSAKAVFDINYSIDYFIQWFNFSFRASAIAVGIEHNWKFYNTTGVNIAHFKIDGLEFEWREPGGGWERIGAVGEWNGDQAKWWNLSVNIIDADTWVIDNGQSNETVNPYVVTEDYRVIDFRIETVGAAITWIDGISLDFDVTTSEEAQFKRMYFDFFDLTTGQALTLYGGGYTGSIGTYSIYGYIESDFLPIGYKSNEIWGHTLEIVSYWNLDDWGYINFNDLFGNLGSGQTVTYNNYEWFGQLLNNKHYRINLGEVNEFDGFENQKKRDLAAGSVTLATDKEYYDPGEVVKIRYSLPSHTQLDQSGYDPSGWEIWVYNDDKRFSPGPFGFLAIWETDGGNSADYVYSIPMGHYDNNYHVITHEFPEPTDGFSHYKTYIAKEGWPLDNFLIQDPVRFYIVEDGASGPSGNITAISPAVPEVGQEAIITFNASNRGQISYRSAGSNIWRLIGTFGKYTGNQEIPYTFWREGLYYLKLEVSGPQEDFIIIDESFNFWVNDTLDAYGGAGYNQEYLEVNPARAVAGEDIIFIKYKSLVNDSGLIITDARGQRTLHSTTLMNKSGTYSFKLAPYAAIGPWNVTFFANNTLYSGFNVIAEANNYIEFDRNVYYNYDYKSKAYGEFQIIIRHDLPVKLIFYKENNEEGTDIILDRNETPQGLITIPVDQIRPEVGNWRVEMYELGAGLIQKRLLSFDNCTVKQGKITQEELKEPGYDDILSILALGGEIFGGGEFGLMFMALIFMVIIVFLLTGFNDKKPGKAQNDVTFLVAIAFMLFFAVIGWLPIWLAVVAIVISAFLFSDALSKKVGFKGGS